MADLGSPSETTPEIRRGAFDQACLQLARLQIRPGTSSHEVFTVGARIVTGALGIERMSLWLFINDGQAIRCLYLFHPALGEVFEGSMLQAVDFPEYFKSLHSRRVVAVDDAPHDPATRELERAYLAPLGITSMLDAPIYRAGRMAGIVCLEHIGPSRKWTREERDFATAVAEVIGRLCEEAARLTAETELNNYQAQIAHLQRFDALGRMAAGIAHDFRGMLSTVVGFAHLIADDAKVPESAREQARQIVEAGDRGVQLTRELLAFGKGSRSLPVVLDVREVIQNIQDMLQMAAGQRIKLAFRLHDVSRVLMDRALLERAVVNLVSNARDAMPQGGTIDVSVDETRRPGPNGHDVGYVVVEVRDEGVGMDMDTSQRIFEPFFTTKGEAGSGLGLVVVQQAMARGGGTVEIATTPGQGTTVRLLLPRIAAPVGVKR